MESGRGPSDADSASRKRVGSAVEPSVVQNEQAADPFSTRACPILSIASLQDALLQQCAAEREFPFPHNLRWRLGRCGRRSGVRRRACSSTPPLLRARACAMSTVAGTLDGQPVQVCFECLLEIDGAPNIQGCLVPLHTRLCRRTQDGVHDRLALKPRVRCWHEPKPRWHLMEHRVPSRAVPVGSAETVGIAIVGPSLPAWLRLSAHADTG